MNIYLLNGTLFATNYNRIVHGERGDYVEFEKEHIVPKLIPKFKGPITDDIYYHWLVPKTDLETKVYYQRKTVKYADYKIGKYYVSPYLLKDFQDPEQIFPYSSDLTEHGSLKACVDSHLDSRSDRLAS